MKRIMVIGISAGVGKSTFARRLGKTLGMQVYHLDALYWKPGWVESSLEEFKHAQQELVSLNEWIIEGNYSSTYELRAERADTLIYLELPLWVCLYRVLKRWLMNVGKTRPDMAQGCNEKIDWKFIRFICTTYYPRKRKTEDRFSQLESSGSEKTIIRLKSKHAIRSYLKRMETNQHEMSFRR